MNNSKVLNLTTSEIVTQICNAYTNSLGIFKEKHNAEDLVPNTTKETQIQFLFWVIQMDYATKSSRLYENANRLYKSNPNWINCEYISNISNKDLYKLIQQELRPRYTNEICKRFKLNCKKLEDNYSGKAINIVKASKTAKELLENIKDFRGFGDKLANFLTRTYIDLLKPKYSDIEDIFQPVDVHDVRLTYEWELIENKEMTKGNILKVKKIWQQACIKSNKSWIIFDKALWLIGSGGVRTNNINADFNINLGK
jgi:endonuclease III